ncbi:HD domain-containing phosphohydrolase [Leadbettera azotonutricia]|uniref:HD domain protein n=1 Tax=Leadbettera azotonutricia (strain ATCC BAA-888 / DSM 13862 / ZAS-9) TaxID=545695 RepID=F5YDJ5_LEAAZ|nr:HD domain-containing phosphohydrolase [Leadbettera azotonutricia]AEF82465.1 HD domain protein [Leadbettera azotonutricia ZAS-9]
MADEQIELQELDDDLEPLEVLELDEEPSSEIAQKCSSTESSLFSNSIFPVLLVDRMMKILYANKACENFFTGFFELAGNYFIDVFGRAFEMEDIRAIRETIREGTNGYSWKGVAKIKSRNVATVQTRVHLFPAELDSKDPMEFVVLFDDVTEEHNRPLRSVFMSLLEASKLKDNDTGKHIVRVSYYAKRLSEELFRGKNPKYNRIDADFIDNIGFLASMHDVGKIGTPDDILNKQGPLADWEWTLMREHTKNGAFILSTYPNPMAKEIALSHHERWDGSGYPYQLSGEMIPLAARITTISDVYDALRMERSYKPALAHDVTVQKMLEGKESHFDPFLVDVFTGIHKDFENIFDSNKDE